MGNWQNIPEMFSMVYTAAPKEVFWDIFENNVTFDEASQKQMDRQMDFDPFADFMLDDPMEDEFVIEKAIYQEGIRRNTNKDVGGIETPHGLGLENDTLAIVLDAYPGAKAIAGVDVEDFSDLFTEAELFADQYGSDIDETLDTVKSKAEAEGTLDLVPQALDAVGVNIEKAAGLALPGNVGKIEGYTEPLSTEEEEEDFGGISPSDILKGAAKPFQDLVDPLVNPTEVAAEGIEVDEDLQGLFDLLDAARIPNKEDDYLGTPDDFGETIKEILATTDYTTNDILLYQQQQGWEDSNPFSQAINRALDVNEESEADAMLGRDIRELGGSLGDVGAYADASGQHWINLLTNQYSTYSNITNEKNIFAKQNPDQKTDAFGENWVPWHPDADMGQMVTDTKGMNLEDKRDYLFEMYKTLPNYDRWSAGYNAIPGGNPLLGDTNLDFLKKTTDPKEVAPGRGAFGSPGGGASTAVPEEGEAEIWLATAEGAQQDLDANYATNLKKVFYTNVWGQPGGTASNIQKDLARANYDTQMLFLLFRGRNIWDSISGLESAAATLNKQYKDDIENNYDVFLGEYFFNPDAYRRGPGFKRRLDYISRILEKNENSPFYMTDPSWTDQERADQPWIVGLFGGEDNKARRRRLIKLDYTNGGGGLFAQAVHAAIDTSMNHYVTLGFSEEDVFQMFSKWRTPESLKLDAQGKVAVTKDEEGGDDTPKKIAGNVVTGSPEEDDKILGMGEEKTKVIEDPFDEASFHQYSPLTPEENLEIEAMLGGGSFKKPTGNGVGTMPGIQSKTFDEELQWELGPSRSNGRGWNPKL